jgi:hypothetical protein
MNTYKLLFGLFTAFQISLAQAVYVEVDDAQFTITTSATIGGTVSGGGTFDEDASVTLTATPSNSDYKFSGWSGDVSGTSNPLTIKADSNKTITANFVIPSIAGDPKTPVNQTFKDLLSDIESSGDSTPTVTLISNGGIIGWYDQDSLSAAVDPETGMPMLNARGRPEVIYDTLASFTGSTTFTFPENQKIGIHAESDQNATLAYWIVDGEVKLSNNPDNIIGGEWILSMQHPHIIIDSNVSTLEAVFVPIPKEASPYIPTLNGNSKIISNGGVIQWISPQPNPVPGVDPTTGMPLLDESGKPTAIRTILGYFTGTQDYSFPSTSDLTFYAEPKVNHTFSYWLVDGVANLGLVNDSSSSGGQFIIPNFPDKSITVQSSFSTLEAVYSPIPEGSADYIGATESSDTHYTEGWFYNPSRGWMWTDSTAYPYFYDATDKDWMYFQSGNDKPKFYRYKTKTWLTVY